MYKNVMSGIPGIEFYPIVALVLFFGFFVGLIVWYIRVDRSKLENAARLAMQDSASSEYSPTHSTRS